MLSDLECQGFAWLRCETKGIAAVAGILLIGSVQAEKRHRSPRC